MITASPLPAQPVGVDWRQQWREAERDSVRLLSRLGLDFLAERLANAGLRDFPLLVPASFIERMRPGDPNDPLLRQILPMDDEDRLVPGFVDDAVGDVRALTANGVLQKYRGRALLIATGSCAVHCRYCFRRHFPYAEATAAAARWGAALEQLRGDRSINEVILSGGDPLSLSDAKLAELIDALDAMPHLRTLRIHSRLPVVLPARVDAGLLSLLGRSRLRKVVVIHANHGNELRLHNQPHAETAAALAALHDQGCTLLNQAVLLRGVNDSVDALAGLSEALFDVGVMPYYLHQLDRVRGAAHFEVDDATAVHLIDSLRTRLPGYLIPRLVREVPGAASKTPI
ncbi:MAG: EF-P beta-lysylation protein EpmB [Xanthomonadales bacterium]|nr:EF-P beta-lysylation protein EpmB [Xanthomonadales bacterium]